ncbi:hypothetical protein L207DRAFT_509860 [Hyaloscypha variabilis F]|uniref:Uncharacterized protein n=1 Tax=Hyaloscypha variabilis (strain UAMH 11265 / GT02V1 / F) TaxID=1149755 RepID=A0A2J6RXU8_HYAVF|nr:hypothetical protein L207DRAFT_509860 [Hyaloscypha variabilis F]
MSNSLIFKHSRRERRKKAPKPYLISLDEATFEIGKCGRIWVTRRVDEKRCISYMRSVY